MNLSPDIYNNKNSLQYGLADELIERIIEENGEKNFDICIDIGCGTGNVTLMLESMLNIKHLYAIDIDNEMIEFSKLNHNQPNIQYLTQDIGVEWNQLRPELRALEGKVSLIFTNMMLHWVYNNNENAAKNIFRLISDNGKVYAIVFCYSDPFNHLLGEEKIEHEKQIYFPTTNKQMQIWNNLFEKVGFRSVKAECLEKQAILEEEEFREGILPVNVNCRKQFILEEDHSKRIEVIDRLTKRLFDINRKFIEENSGKEMTVWAYQIFRFVLSNKSHINL